MNNFGIINYSNNCYLNVIIQIFLSYKVTSNIISHYLDFVSNSNGLIINPKKLLTLLSKKMEVRRQNDSQEAFTQLLDLIPDLEKYYKNTITNVFLCHECNNIRKICDTFCTFYVHTNSLEDSIKQLISDEIFNLECDHCKKYTKTSKKCRIKNLGNVLVFYNILKQKIKFTNNISYSDTVYKLTGIIKHYGNENSGHYIYIDYTNKKIIDDTSINSYNKIDNNNIYLLFYCKE